MSSPHNRVQSWWELLPICHTTNSYRLTIQAFVQYWQWFNLVTRQIRTRLIKNKSIMASWDKNTVYYDTKDNTQLVHFKRFLPRNPTTKTSIKIPSKSFWFLNADKHLKRKHNFHSSITTWRTKQQCLEPFASFAGSINILTVDLVTDIML